MSIESNTGTAAPGIKSEVNEIGPCKLSIKVEIPAADCHAKLQEKFRLLGETVVLPGFRKGKVPRKILEKRFGKEVEGEAKGDLLRESFDKVVQEKKLVILGDPEVDVDAITFQPDAPMAFEVKVEVRPTIQLGTYKGLSASRTIKAVGDADVEAALDAIRERQAELVAVQGEGAALKDTIICDEEFLVDGMEPVRHENIEILIDGEHLTIFGEQHKELAASLVGAKAGESREAGATVPTGFADEKLRGKSGKLRITVQDIKRPRLPEATDEWAKTLDFENLSHMRAEVRKRISQQHEEESTESVQMQLVEQLVTSHTFPVPEGMVGKMQNDILQRKHAELEMAGVPHEQIHKYLDESKNGLKEAVEKGLRAQLLLDEIGKKERIFVTESEVDARIEEVARRNKRWPHEVREHYEKHGMMSQLRTQLREEKVRRYLVGQAKVSDAPAPA